MDSSGHAGLTSVRDLTGVTAGRGRSPLREGGADLGQALGSGAGSDALVLGQDDLLHLAVRALDLGLDGYDLISRPAFLLCALGPLETLGRKGIHALAGDAKVPADVLAGPAHGLHAVGGLLALSNNVLVEGLVEAVAADGHGLSAHGNSHGDRAGGDGVCNVGRGLETGGAEAVDGRGTGRIGEAGGEGGSAGLVGSLGIGDLVNAKCQ